MKVAIVGSRSFQPIWLVRQFIDTLSPGTWIVSGGAAGVDSEAAYYALNRRLPTLIFPADWERYGNSAGYRRNNQIIGAADRVVAFWDGKSKGTKHSIDMAKSAEKPLTIIAPDGTRTEVRYSDRGEQVALPIG